MITIAEKVEIITESKEGEVKIDESALCDIKDMEVFLCIRTDGEFEGKGFYLDDGYDWVIVEKDSQGEQVLVPIKKG